MYIKATSNFTSSNFLLSPLHLASSIFNHSNTASEREISELSSHTKFFILNTMEETSGKEKSLISEHLEATMLEQSNSIFVSLFSLLQDLVPLVKIDNHPSTNQAILELIDSFRSMLESHKLCMEKFGGKYENFREACKEVRHKYEELPEMLDTEDHEKALYIRKVLDSRSSRIQQQEHILEERSRSLHLYAQILENQLSLMKKWGEREALRV
jgi:hypothetical protein